jgi:hypothetical protein
MNRVSAAPAIPEITVSAPPFGGATRSNIRATSFPWNHRNGDRPAYRIHQPIVEKAGERGANR